MTIVSMPERFLCHSFGVKKAMSAIATLKTTDEVIPFLPVKSSMPAFWAGKFNGCIQFRHLPPPI